MRDVVAMSSHREHCAAAWLVPAFGAAQARLPRHAPRQEANLKGGMEKRSTDAWWLPFSWSS